MWAIGVDYSIKPVMDTIGEIDMPGVNVGNGKYFPGGPKCMFNGKEVPCLTFVSKSDPSPLRFL
jgi:hypothetical protein